MNKHRQVIYDFRNDIINGEDVRDRLMDIMEEVVVEKVLEFTNTDTDHTEWKLRPLADWVNLNFPLGMPEAEIVKAADAGKDEPVAGSLYDGLSPARFAVCNFISDSVRKAYDIKISFENPDALREVERFTILSAIDRLWQEHLYEMDSLRYSIGLRGYGQRDPLVEYKAEAFKMFNKLMVNVKTQVCPTTSSAARRPCWRLKTSCATCRNRRCTRRPARSAAARRPPAPAAGRPGAAMSSAKPRRLGSRGKKPGPSAPARK